MPDPRELLRAQRADHRLHSVVPCRAAPRPNPQRAERQIQLVVQQHQVLFRLRFVLRAPTRAPTRRSGSCRFPAWPARHLRPPMRPRAVCARQWRLFTRTPHCSAIRSTARKPMLCGVNWYSMPGLPSPTISFTPPTSSSRTSRPSRPCRPSRRQQLRLRRPACPS